MRPITALVPAIVLAITANTFAQEATRTARKPIYDEKADAREQIDAALASAKKENRRVLIQWGANWCGWCHLLHDAFEKDKDVKRTLMYEYDVVLVDIGRWDKHLDIAEQYGADFASSGVPYLTILDAEGNVLANRETGSLEAKQADGESGHDGKKVVTFLEKHQAPYAPAESLLADALAEAAKTDRRVFLHFGAPWCGWCKRMEAWMARPEVAELLAIDFIDLKIDVDRTIGGKDVMKRFVGETPKGIPWFAFLDAEGNVLASSDMQDGGNIGCPWADEEIAAFEAVLDQASAKLTDEQIAAIATDLREYRDKAERKRKERQRSTGSGG